MVTTAPTGVGEGEEEESNKNNTRKKRLSTNLLKTNQVKFSAANITRSVIQVVPKVVS